MEESFAQVYPHSRRKEAPDPRSETWDAYVKSQESTGVMSMMDLLIKGLDKEMTEAETKGKDAQADYEELIRESAERQTSRPPQKPTRPSRRTRPPSSWPSCLDKEMSEAETKGKDAQADYKELMRESAERQTSRPPQKPTRCSRRTRPPRSWPSCWWAGARSEGD
uniref:Uncharacterized protein n=1 Tax=Alexandrium monilatum TaxID=311494 RepID=A0A7S4Q422_9DINO